MFVLTGDQVNSLTAELQKANELLTETGSKSSQVSQQQLAEIFPTAAATSSLLKSGMTLTQVSNVTHTSQISYLKPNFS